MASKTYINTAGQGVYEVDHTARTIDIPEHDGSSKGLKLAGTLVTATAAELNLLDGATATAAQHNFLAGVTAGTSAASKAVVLDANSKINAIDITALTLNGTAVTSTAAELNKLDGVASTAAEIDQRALSFTMTLGTATSYFVVIPWACNVTRVYTAITAAIATANEVITLENNAGTAMADSTLTITQAGSAAGDVDFCSPSTNNAFTEGQKLEIITDGGSDGGTAIVTVLCTIT